MSFKCVFSSQYKSNLTSTAFHKATKQIHNGVKGDRHYASPSAAHTTTAGSSSSTVLLAQA